MSFRRGFKAEAERLAAQLRGDAGVLGDGPLPLDRLAGLLKARIVAADKLVPRSRLAQLNALQDDAFSACTFSFDDESVVVFNPLHLKGRQNSDIAHELAHLALGHTLRRIERIGAFSFFTCDADQEAEANWLAGALLLPRGVLLQSLHRALGAEQIAAQYEVSPQMANYRLKSTGVATQFERARRLRGTPAL